MLVENKKQVQEFEQIYKTEDCIIIPIQCDSNKHSVNDCYTYKRGAVKSLYYHSIIVRLLILKFQISNQIQKNIHMILRN